MGSKLRRKAHKKARMSPLEPPKGSPEKPDLRTEEHTMSQNEPVFQEDLSDRQIVALPHVAAAATNAEGARAADISLATLKRWRQDPAFREELRRQRQETSDLAQVELDGLALKSISALAELLEDPNPRVRMQAVRLALVVGIQVGKARENQRRLRQLEKALTLLKNLK